MWYFPSTSTDISARYATNTGMMSRRMTDREVGVKVYRLRRNGGWIEMQKDHIQSLDPEKLDDINGGTSIPADLRSNEGIAAFCTAVDRIASTQGKESALSYIVKYYTTLDIQKLLTEDNGSASLGQLLYRKLTGIL